MLTPKFPSTCGVLLLVIFIQLSFFTSALLLPRPVTGIGKSVPNHQQRREVIPPQSTNFKITGKDLNQSVVFASGIFDRLRRLETALGWSNIAVKQGTPAHGQYIESFPDDVAVDQGKTALVAIKATMHLMSRFCNKYKLDGVTCSRFISTFTLQNTPLEAACASFQKSCTSKELNSKYRSIDGSCNRDDGDGSWGASFTAYKRLLFPEYLDGVQEPRRAVSKKALPSARMISSVLTSKAPHLDHDLTVALQYWSEFIEHDLVHTATSRMVHTNKPIECCTNGINLSPRYIHPFCSPIAVPDDDQYYSVHGLDCMTYVRSIPAFKQGCRFGPIDQMNQATHFLDGSQIYGTTSQKSTKLRTLSNGQLKSTLKNNRSFLPTSTQPLQDCQVADNGSECFVAGDSRVNAHPQLAAMHTLWMREHNRIGRILADLNPNWGDERVFQEARRIVIAELQHITYTEFLPHLLGEPYVKKINGFSAYTKNVNPSVSNSFATAALRVLNTLLSGKVRFYKEDRALNMSLPLREYFNKPHIVEEPGYFDAMVRGFATEKTRKLDFMFVDDIRNHLFSNGVYGFDVLSLDIQRGRDHGLPGYTSFRELCGLTDAKTFDDFADAIPNDSIALLKSVYNSTEDVDLIVGGLAERPVSGSLFGPTFSCIISDQFIRTRRGDRYFYTHTTQPVAFTAAQLKHIKNVSLARIFCDNGDDIKMMQPNVFKPISERNPLVDCDSGVIPKLDLYAWKEVLY